MKKIINNPEDLVIEMCEGMVAAHPNQLTLNKKRKLLLRKDLNPDKVSLISGGGSGHEPGHAGYVGKGMLDVAVCGDVFASPSTIQVYQGLLATESDKGALLIIKNYSGDIMNFEAAAEMAEEDGIKVEKVYVNDDIAVKDSLYTVGRRGVAGTVLVHKIAGAAAEEGKSLEEVKTLAQDVVDHVRSIGFALTSCTVPAKGSPTFNLEEDEIEFGVGIHGEPGTERQGLKPAKDLVDDCVHRLMDEGLYHEGDQVVAMVNGFGGTPLQELYVINKNLSENLSKRGIKVYDTMVGNFMTSIDMAGASITLLKTDEAMRAYYDAPADTIAIKK